MPLFAKNKPTQRENFEGGFVELQYLSKGVKDEIKARAASVYQGIDISKLQNAKSEADIPIEAFAKIPQLMEIEYYKLAHAIKSWSDSETPINEDTVKEMDEEIFNQVSKKVDEMNQLKPEQEKN
jgi:hypothetical protein